MTTERAPHPMREYKANRMRQIAYGRWEPYVDAQPVREHVTTLMAYGLAPYAIACLAGVSNFAVTELMYGIPSSGRGPSAQLLKKTATALLAVRFDLDDFPDGMMIDASGTRRRIQALAALGYPISYQAERLGRACTNVHRLMRVQRVTAATARQVRGLYEELSMRPPAVTRAGKIARTVAAKHGWLLPLSLDDELIDLPDELMWAELDARAAAMSMEELRPADKARALGDRSPMILAAAREYRRRLERKEAAS